MIFYIIEEIISLLYKMTSFIKLIITWKKPKMLQLAPLSREYTPHAQTLPPSDSGWGMVWEIVVYSGKYDHNQL